jgi:type II secretory pathway pseudopilin PulG
MRAQSLKSSAGFTYLAAIILVVLLGIMLGAVGQSWKTVMKRENEAELLFRGGQILDAIVKWRSPNARLGQQPSQTQMPIRDLKDLLEDPRSAEKFHYLRKIYTDPITKKEFNIIRDPTQGIIGVASSSKEKPLKLDFQNMSGVYKTFTNKQKYSDWKFVPSELQKFLPPETTVKPPGQP